MSREASELINPNANRLLETKQLRQFAVIVETGNMSRAAELLNISQPALTQGIKNIEATVGARVLMRKPRGVEPTAEGKHLYIYAIKILNDTYNAMHEVKLLSAGELGQVNIGVASFLCDKFAPELVLELNRRHPKLTITITEGKLYDLVKELSSRHLDMVFSNYNSFSDWVKFRFEPLAPMRTNFLISNTHPLFKARKFTKKKLENCKLALPRLPHEGDSFYTLYSDFGFDVTGALVTNSMQLLRSLVMSGEYITILPEHLFATEIKSGKVKPLDLKGMPIVRDFGIITTDENTQKNQVNIVAGVARELSVSVIRPS